MLTRVLIVLVAIFAAVKTYGEPKVEVKEEGTVEKRVPSETNDLYRSLLSFSPFRPIGWPLYSSLFNYLSFDEVEPLSELMSAYLIESDTEYYIHCDAPGVENLDMTVSNGALHITADRKVFHEVNNDFVYSTERSSGKIYKKIPLPSNADVDKAQAQYKDGIVHVSFPKKADGGAKKLVIN